MIATNLREEIKMVRAQIRVHINPTLTTNIERRPINLLKMVIERMVTNVMTNRETPSRIHKMILGRRKTLINRVLLKNVPVWSLSTRVLPAQIPLLKLSTHLSQTSIIVLAARSIQSVMNVQMHSNKCRSKRLVQRFCRSLQTSVLFFPHITIRNVSLSNTEKHF